MRPRDSREADSVRRIEHAHRVGHPPGTTEGRPVAGSNRPRGRAATGAGSIIAVVVVMLLALALRPWEGSLGFAGRPQASGTPGGTATGPTALATHAAVATITPSIGPHGDGVTGPEPTDAVTPGPSLDPGPGPTADAPLLSGYQWPMRNARITNGFGPGRPSSFSLDGTSFHDGIDIASFCGARITAAHAGTVLGAGRRTHELLGWVGDLTAFRAKLDAKDAWGTQAITVVIDDGNGFRSIYAHLGVATVKKGEIVEAGDQIGWEGASGNATGCHLHYALFDPLEEDTLTLDPKIAARTRLPAMEIARIDPLLVLPPPATAAITWGWGAR